MVRLEPGHRRRSPAGVVETIATLAVTIAIAPATVAAAAAAEVATATTAATEATAAAAAATKAATTAAAAEAATTAAATATEAAARRTRSAGLRFIHDESATLEFLAVEAFNGGRASFLRAHGHEAEAARATGFAIRSDEHIQHLSMRREQFAKPIRSRTIVEITYKDLEHVWPPRPGGAMHRVKHAWTE
jgi:hypothetical protein